MIRAVSLLLSAALLCVMSNRASAHLGHGSEIQVRVFDDKIRIVLRTAVVNAWSFMGEGAPETFDEIGQGAAIPQLKKLAPELMLLRRDGVNLVPLEVDAVFEVDDHVAFVYVFPLPDEGPVEVEARFLRSLGDMETARLTAFDHSGASPGNDAKTFLMKNLYRGNFRASVDLPRIAINRVSPSLHANTPSAAEHESSFMVRGVGIAAAATILVCLGWVVLRRARKS